jgi:hypothetical protein
MKALELAVKQSTSIIVQASASQYNILKGTSYMDITMAISAISV